MHLMRILVVTDLPSGKQRFVDDSISALRKSGHEVEVLSLRDHRGFEAQNRIRDAHGLAVISSDFQLSLFKFSILAARLISMCLAGRRHAKFIRDCANFTTMGVQLGAVIAQKYILAAKAISAFGPDVIHVHFAWNVRHVLAISSYLQVPIVVTVHGSDILKRNEWESDLRAKEIKRIACVSQYLKNRVDAVPALSHKTAFVPNSINSVFCTSLKNPPADLAILCVASLRTLKNHIWLIRALESLFREGVHFKCKFVGEPMPGEELHAEFLKQQVQDSGMADFVDFEGWLDKSDVRDLIDASTVCVLPSTSEGFGVFIIEALSRARCAVVSDIPGCREAVSHGAYGVVVPLNSDELLCKGILEGHRITIWERERMRHAREYVISNFSPEAHARSLATVFEGALR